MFLIKVKFYWFNILADKWPVNRLGCKLGSNIKPLTDVYRCSQKLTYTHHGSSCPHGGAKYLLKKNFMVIQDQSIEGLFCFFNHNEKRYVWRSKVEAFNIYIISWSLSWETMNLLRHLTVSWSSAWIIEQILCLLDLTLKWTTHGDKNRSDEAQEVQRA